jgi:acyl-CoA reductase-like NAD-dependent aldehyde dehydrogenase
MANNRIPCTYTGEAIMKSDEVRKIGFTGSTAVGKLLMAGASATVKRVSLELGGNAPFIVFDDADLELAAKHVVASAFRNAGQTCISASRVFVQARGRAAAPVAGLSGVFLGFCGLGRRTLGWTCQYNPWTLRP